MLQTLLDKQALYELMCHYCRAVDSKQFHQLAALYHPDAIHDHGDIFCGNLTDYITFLTEQMRDMTTQHMIGNHLYQLDGDRATGEIYTVNYHVFHRPEGDLEYAAGGRYLDTYMREDSRWRIVSRQRVIDWHGDRSVDRPSA